MSTVNTYPLGTSVKVTAAFFDEDGDAFDPATVTCMVKLPDETEASYVYGVDAAVVKDSVGNYHFWIETEQAETYSYRWKGSGAVKVANEGSFEVTESAFATP